MPDRAAQWPAIRGRHRRGGRSISIAIRPPYGICEVVEDNMANAALPLPSVSSAQELTGRP